MVLHKKKHSHFNVKEVIILSLVLSVAAALAFWGGFSIAKQYGIKDKSLSEEIVKTPQTRYVSETVVLTTQPTKESEARHTFQTRIIETDVTLSSSFPSTGETVVNSNYAEGTITVTNTTNRSFAFVKTTRFLSNEGVLFRSKTPISIPANGTATVAVIADKPGPSGDISETSFTIPGLSSDLQAQITGKSSKPMSGGSGIAHVVLEKDIETAKSVLLEKMRQEALANLGAMVSDGEVVLPELLDITEISMETEKAGTVSPVFRVLITNRFRTLVVPEKKLHNFLFTEKENTLIEDISLVVNAFDVKSERAEIRVEGKINEL